MSFPGNPGAGFVIEDSELGSRESNSRIPDSRAVPRRERTTGAPRPGTEGHNSRTVDHLGVALSITRAEVIGATSGGAIAAAGLWHWLAAGATASLSLLLLGGFVCGFLAADTGSDGLEVAILRVLPVALAGSGVWALSAVSGADAPTGAILAGFVLAVSLLLTYVPLLFLPFAGASAVGGFVRGKATGGVAETD